MSTVEETVSVMKNLTQSEQKEVYHYAQFILFNKKKENPFKPVTKQQVLNDLTISEKEFREGKGVDGIQAIRELRRKHGFI